MNKEAGRRKQERSKQATSGKQQEASNKREAGCRMLEARGIGQEKVGRRLQAGSRWQEAAGET